MSSQEESKTAPQLIQNSLDILAKLQEKLEIMKDPLKQKELEEDLEYRIQSKKEQEKKKSALQDLLIELEEAEVNTKALSPKNKNNLRKQIEDFQDEYSVLLTKQERNTLERYSSVLQHLNTNTNTEEPLPLQPSLTRIQESYLLGTGKKSEVKNTQNPMMKGTKEQFKNARKKSQKANVPAAESASPPLVPSIGKNRKNRKTRKSRR